MHQDVRIGEKPEFDIRPGARSPWAQVLITAGVIGVFLSLAAAAGLLLQVMGIAELAGLLTYGLGFAVLTVVSSRTQAKRIKWFWRLGAPLPGALLIWFVLGLFGL